MSNEQEPKENRSYAPTPAQLAEQTARATNETKTLVAAAVKEAIAGMFEQMGPILQSMAITPEKLREANKPYKDPATVARELREMLIWKEDEAETRRMTEERQNACPHTDKNNRSTLQLVHNYPDRQPRGVCAHCQALVHPREWRIGAPDAKHPRGVPYLVAAHKNYATVMQLESQS